MKSSELDESKRIKDENLIASQLRRDQARAQTAAAGNIDARLMAREQSSIEDKGELDNVSQEQAAERALRQAQAVAMAEEAARQQEEDEDEEEDDEAEKSDEKEEKKEVRQEMKRQAMAQAKQQAMAKIRQVLIRRAMVALVALGCSSQVAIWIIIITVIIAALYYVLDKLFLV